MRAEVKKDVTVRTIGITVQDGPVLDVTEPWQNRPHLIRLTWVFIRIAGGETRSLRVNGPLLKKDGTDSLIDGERVWSAAVPGRSIADAPDWARMLWQDAPAGVRTWVWTSGMLGEQ